jgi:membrane fusion protein, heavy metal efflux system
VRGFVSEELTEGKIAIDAERATPVLSPYSGRVQRVTAALGQHVRAGEPLAFIEATEFVQAQNDLHMALTQAVLTRLSETRKHALFDAKGGSQQDWQQAQAELAAAETSLNAARGKLRALGQSDAQVKRLETLKTVEPLAALDAPIAGVVVDRQIGAGQFLQPGGNALFTVADAASVWLLANVREADAGSVQLGQTAEVHVLAYPNRTFSAKISYIGALVDPATHRIPVRAVLDNRDGALKPEMFASFRILTSEAGQAPAVPQAAVIYEGESAHVWVVAAGGLITYRRVRIGRSNEGWVEVLDGLKDGEQVVTRGALFIDQAAVPASA